MNPKLDRFLYLGEEQYLQSSELADYQAYLAELEKKVKVYEIVRDQEVFIFKILATELQEKYPEERSHIICEAISQWSLVLKYCCTAMLLDNPEYLESRVENWLKELIQLRAVPQMDEILYDTLVEVLPEVLTDAETAFLKPYLEQIQKAIGLAEELEEPEELLSLG